MGAVWLAMGAFDLVLGLYDQRSEEWIDGILYLIFGLVWVLRSPHVGEPQITQLRIDSQGDSEHDIV